MILISIHLKLKQLKNNPPLSSSYLPLSLWGVGTFYEYYRPLLFQRDPIPYSELVRDYRKLAIE